MSELRRVPFFGVVADTQSYINVLYLLMSFPLGIAYFVFLVTGISLGLGLSIIWVGVPILVLVLAGSWALWQLERLLAISLLKENIPAMARRDDRSEQLEDGRPSLGAGERLFIGAWRLLKAHLANRLTWTGMLYLFLKFPLGIASFVMVVVLVAFTGALLGAPFYFSVDDGIDMGIWQVDALWEALILTIIGIPLASISLHLMNGVAFLQGRLARLALGKLEDTRARTSTLLPF